MATALAQVLLAGPDQCEADALPPVPIPNSESVRISSPSVPSGDHSPDDLPATLGNQEGSRGIPDQALDVIGRSGVLACSLRACSQRPSTACASDRGQRRTVICSPVKSGA